MYLKRTTIAIWIFFLISCELDQDSSTESNWIGGETAFTNDFDYLTGSSDQPSLLVRRNSRDLFSGSVERNKSGVLTEQVYKEGKLHGKSIKKSPDGSWVEANYLDGRLHGQIKLYDRSGSLRSIMNYSNGVLVPSQPSLSSD